VEFGPGRDDEIIVGHLSFGRDDPVLFRLDPLGGRLDKLNAALAQHWSQRERDVFPRPPADGHPRIGRDELEIVHMRDDRHGVLLAQQRP
jgi:hypothetical protein